MRVLLTGANGFIGSAVFAALREAGHEVVAVVRRLDASARGLGPTGLVLLDIARAVRPEDWLPHLGSIDAVVNCAGVLQDSAHDSTGGVHASGPAALFAACERAGVRRVVQISAIGVDRETPTAFTRSKLVGDEALQASKLDWVILRPSVVVGRAAYGGSALFRGLAALPFLPEAPETGLLQVVQRDQLVKTVLYFLEPGVPARVTLEIAGPQRLSMTEVVQAYRRWLGWPAARTVVLPPWLARWMFRLGDFAGWLGWRAPMRSTAQAEMRRGAVGDPRAWTQATGMVPRSLVSSLGAEPASVQERWFARLYFLKPITLVTLSVFWILTGLISLGPGFSSGKALVQGAGAGSTLATAAVIGGALADIAIGLGMAFRRSARVALFAACALTLAYLVIATALVPRLWIEPLGPLLKAFPIVVLHLFALAILEDR